MLIGKKSISIYYFIYMNTKEKELTASEKRRLTCIKKYGVDNPAKCKSIQEKMKKTCMERYGTQNYTSSEHYKENYKIYENRKKSTCLKKYGVEVSSQSDIVKEKNKQTCLERYGVNSYTQTEEFKNRHDEIQEKSKKTYLEKYGVEKYIYTNEFKEKEYKTKKKNKTFNSSSIEKRFEVYLKENNINYKTQYKSEVYPFSCDFYFPDNDLYLEINAHWTHGGHPFDSTNKDDILLLEQWRKRNTKYYDIAINTWTVRDVLKRETAKKNNLNNIEVFTDDINEIVKFLK